MKRRESFKELNLIFHNFFQNIKEEGTLWNLFYEGNITFIPKPGKDTKRKLQINIPDEEIQKILSKILPNWIQQHI